MLFSIRGIDDCRLGLYYSMEFRKNSMIFDEFFKKYLTFNYIRWSPLYWKRFQTADYFCFDGLSSYVFQYLWIAMTTLVAGTRGFG